jgi:hypothetical protein
MHDAPSKHARDEGHDEVDEGQNRGEHSTEQCILHSPSSRASEEISVVVDEFDPVSNEAQLNHAEQEEGEEHEAGEQVSVIWPGSEHENALTL